jgi:hypothetical protein
MQVEDIVRYPLQLGYDRVDTFYHEIGATQGPISGWADTPMPSARRLVVGRDAAPRCHKESPRQHASADGGFLTHWDIVLFDGLSSLGQVLLQTARAMGAGGHEGIAPAVAAAMAHGVYHPELGVFQ